MVLKRYLILERTGLHNDTTSSATSFPHTNTENVLLRESVTWICMSIKQFIIILRLLFYLRHTTCHTLISMFAGSSQLLVMCSVYYYYTILLLLQQSIMYKWLQHYSSIFPVHFCMMNEQYIQRFFY